MHPAQYSPEVIDKLEDLLDGTTHIHDPFAGTGLRLGALCDKLNLTFTGSDIEDWPGKDPRVLVADALDPNSYPRPTLIQGVGYRPEYTIVTSPVYVNKRLADYPNGPTENTKIKGRRDYALGLGHALHEHNLARWTGRKSKAADYWRLHGEAVKLWPDQVIVNVDMPIEVGWIGLLEANGYETYQAFSVTTRRYRGLANADKRAEHETIIVASR